MSSATTQAWPSAARSARSPALRDWDWIIDVNLKGVVYGVETFYPLIKSHGEGGHFVNTASMAGMVSPPNMEPYTATKFAVVAMSEGWAQQLAPMGIGMSVLCPGFVKTRIHESGRARQSRYGDRAPDTRSDEARSEAAKMVLSGIDPDVVGERVLEAIRCGRVLHLHPSRKMKAAVDARFAAIDAGFKPPAVESHAPQSRAQINAALLRHQDVGMNNATSPAVLTSQTSERIWRMPNA